MLMAFSYNSVVGGIVNVCCFLERFVGFCVTGRWCFWFLLAEVSVVTLCCRWSRKMRQDVNNTGTGARGD